MSKNGSEPAFRANILDLGSLSVIFSENTERGTEWTIHPYCLNIQFLGSILENKMNTPTNAYLTKFSSGTILALLLLSGFLFLIPLAAPVNAAQNAAFPTLA